MPVEERVDFEKYVGYVFYIVTYAWAKESTEHLGDYVVFFVIVYP